jgi:hypothetical protein
LETLWKLEKEKRKRTWKISKRTDSGDGRIVVDVTVLKKTLDIFHGNIIDTREDFGDGETTSEG